MPNYVKLNVIIFKKGVPKLFSGFNEGDHLIWESRVSYSRAKYNRLPYSSRANADFIVVKFILRQLSLSPELLYEVVGLKTKHTSSPCKDTANWSIKCSSQPDLMR